MKHCPACEVAGLCGVVLPGSMHTCSSVVRRYRSFMLVAYRGFSFFRASVERPTDPRSTDDVVPVCLFITPHQFETPDAALAAAQAWVDQLSASCVDDAPPWTDEDVERERSIRMHRYHVIGEGRVPRW